MPVSTKNSKKSKKLIIVESPTKAKTIGQFLDSGYQVESSYGHVRDLPKSKLGIDVENNFNPTYIIPKKSQKNATKLKKDAAKASSVILATDEDREGEAIAWHLANLLELNKGDYQRITFHEITPEAIHEALQKPREINENLVDAQQARRVLDRLVGYELSPFLWKKVRRGLSAGRVQSVALRMIVEREKEREAFKSEEYWSLEGIFENQKKEKFSSTLIKIDGKVLEKMSVKNKEESEVLKTKIESVEKFFISEINSKETKKHPLPPFTTSTLQQEASKKLRFSARQTMRLAQMLYEGIELDGGKTAGLITYMRTDSVNLASSAISNARKTIEEKFGKEFLPEKPNFYKTKSKMAQEAHEAIRPTKPDIFPESLKGKVEPNLYKLYNLIWQRFVACQMKEAIFLKTSVSIVDFSEKIVFRSSGGSIKFPGFISVYPVAFEENILPELKNKENVSLNEIKTEQHFTQPPARYNEASLIKTLEENGIGRPSTYAPIISVLQDRFYVEKDQDRRFLPTELGFIVDKILTKNFPEIVDINFTAKIEEEFDKIAEGKNDWHLIIGEFYRPFKKNLEEKYESVEKEEFQEKTDEVCELCGKPMAVKWSRFGKFLGCTGFPECRNIKKIEKPDSNTGIKCPKCEQGQVIIKRTKAKKRMFYGCSRWPDCDFVSWKKPGSENKNEETKE